MNCPYCQGSLCEDSPACPRCGLTMEKAGAFFGTVPRLVPGVSDSAGVLSGADIRSMGRSISAFERRFPQCGFGVALVALGKDIPGAAYTFWVFNRTYQAGGLNQGARNRHLLLLIDTAGRGAWLTMGYGLEPFLSQKTLDACLQKVQPYLEAGNWRAAVSDLLAALEVAMREIVRSFTRTYGLPPPLPDQPRGLGPSSSAW